MFLQTFYSLQKDIEYVTNQNYKLDRHFHSFDGSFEPLSKKIYTINVK